MKKKLKDKISNNETFLFIRGLWDNKRYRSILFLGLYFIFFFLIISTLRDNYRDNQDLVDTQEETIVLSEVVKKQYNELNSYNYTININDKQTIQGNIESTFNSFSYNNRNYTIILDNVYLENNNDLKKVDINKNSKVIVPIELLMPNKILDYIVDLTPIEEIGEDNYKLTYQILSDYFGIDDTHSFNVFISGDSKIREIILDLSEYANEDYIVKISLDYNKIIEE